MGDKKRFSEMATHPLQSWEWGEFRKKTGIEVTRLMEEEKGKTRDTYQITWHKIPKTPLTIGYCPKSVIPSEEVVQKIEKLAHEKRAVMVKFEPNTINDEVSQKTLAHLSERFDLRKGTPLFTKYSLWLDLSPTEDKLFANLHQKTRYNVRLAQKKGVKIVEDPDGFEDYWKLMEETTKRQGFFAHTKEYHRKMWQTMKEAGIGHLMKAVYQEKTLTTWVLFVLNGVLYYPYGASSSDDRKVMASNLMMWEAIRFGKKNNCRLFDMWGSLGPDPDTRDPWYGFHRFKMGYNPNLVEFVGTYDLVTNKTGYSLYTLAEKVRKIWLRVLSFWRGR